jgi:hypothetical protein
VCACVCVCVLQNHFMRPSFSTKSWNDRQFWVMDFHERILIILFEWSMSQSDVWRFFWFKLCLTVLIDLRRFCHNAVVQRLGHAVVQVDAALRCG